MIMELVNFIVEDGLVMIPTLMILGYFIKNTNAINKSFIPFILLVVSCIITPMLLGGYSAENVVQAILVTGGATIGYEGIKNGAKIVRGE